MKSSVTRGAHRTHEIRHEHEPALEDADEMNRLVGGVLALDLRPHLGDPRPDLFRGKQRLHVVPGS